MDMKSAAKSALLIMGITLGSKMLGFIREMVIAAGFGASYYTDAYVVALTIPAVLFASFSRALQTTFIPIFNELLYQGEKKEAFLFANSALNVVMIFVAVVSGLAFLFMPQITHIISPGFTGEVYHLTVTLARIMITMGIVWGVLGVTGGILNSFKLFALPAAAGIIYNIIIVGAVVILGPSFGIKGLAVGTALGVVGQFLIQVPGLRRLGVTWRCHIQLNNVALKKMGKLMLPILASSVMVQLNVVVDRLLASKLPEGSIAALNFANRLNGFVLGVFVLAFVTVIFPALSQKSAEGDYSGFKILFLQGIKIVMFLTVPATVIILVLKVPMIRLLFERGAFNSHDTLITATAFLYYGVGLLAFGLREVINVAYYSVQDTRTPMLIGIGCLLLNIILNLILVRPMAHGGLALATSLAVTVYTVLMLILLYRKLKWKNAKELLLLFGKIVMAGVVMGIVIIIGKALMGDGLDMDLSFIQQAFYLGGLIFLGGLAYLTTAWMLRINELWVIFSMIGDIRKKHF